MINERLVNNPNIEQEEKMKPMNKAEGQEKLFELFRLRTTEDFQSTLQKGDFTLAQQWLDYIVENQENFLEFQANWDAWHSDRVAELKIYQQFATEGKLKEMKFRTKEEAQKDLQEKFGFCNTNGFQVALQKGDIETAKNWFAYIQKNKLEFPQYLPCWGRWVADREGELAAAEKKNS